HPIRSESRMTFGLFALALMIVAPDHSPRGDDRSAEAVAERIAETQVSLEVGAVRGQATVIRKTRAALVIETAAHVVSTADLGRVVRVGRPGVRLAGRITYVARNPGFPAYGSGDDAARWASETIGVDSAVVVVELLSDSAATRRAIDSI